MLVAFSISPSAADETGSVSDAVAAAVRVVRDSGLPNETNALFTNMGDRPAHQKQQTVWEACPP